MRIKVRKRPVIPPFFEAKYAVTTAASDNLSLSLLLDACTQLQVAYGIAKDTRNMPFWLFLCNSPAN